MTDASSAGAASVVRRAQPQDVDRILDLLTEYDLPRSFFEPLYRSDSTYRPEQSWLIEQDGRLAAHVRLFDRWIRMHETTLQIAGVGNVITAKAFRGQGLAGRLLRAMTAAATGERFAYSMLWTHLPALYERYGWVAIEEHAIHALVSDPSGGITLDSFRLEDLPDVMRIYEATNRSRTGPTIRTPDYWRSQLAWLENDPGDFMVARTQSGSVAAYIRSRVTQSQVRILELGAATEHKHLGRALVGRVAQRREKHVQARLPPSLLDVIPDGERDIDQDSWFMGRILNVDSLVDALAPVLLRRVEAADLGGGAFTLSTNAGSVDVALADGRVTLHHHGPADPAAGLTEGELAHLLFHGFDQMAVDLLDGRPDAAMLRTLFPAQDFVIWPADAF